MKYLKSVFISLAMFYAEINSGCAQKTQEQSIISAQTIVLRYQKQTDTLRIPVVSDQYPGLKKALSYKNIFNGDDLQDVIKNYSSCGCGITGLNYDVTYQDKGVLSIILYFDTMGAYPDKSQKWLTFDIQTGEAYSLTKEINAKGLQWIFDNYKAMLLKRIDADKLQNTDENDDQYNDLKTTADSLESGELFGKYVFIKKGIMFSTEKIFPHVFEALEPNRDWIIPFDKLKDFKARDAVVLSK